MKIFRNIYFLKNIFPQGKGDNDILYYGTMYSNAKQIKDFDKLFDKQQDLLISCNDCAIKKYGIFKKVKKQ